MQPAFLVMPLVAVVLLAIVQIKSNRGLRQAMQLIHRSSWSGAIHAPRGTIGRLPRHRHGQVANTASNKLDEAAAPSGRGQVCSKAVTFGISLARKSTNERTAGSNPVR